MNVIDFVPTRTREKILAGALAPVQQFLPASLIEQWCRELKYSWRERYWGPVVTVLACVWKQAQAASCRAVEDWAATFSGVEPEEQRDGKDFCDARGRLPLEIFARSVWHLGRQAAAQAAWNFKGLQVSIYDGTTFRAPRTSANKKELGCSRNGHAASRLPVLRAVMRNCAGSGAVLDAALGAYGASEMRLIRTLLERLEANVLLVLDRGFSSFMLLWLAQQRNCHVLARHHQTRKGELRRRLGEDDAVYAWQRPQKCRVTWADLWAQTPDEIEVRVVERTIERPGYRPWKLKLVTTLLDAEKYPADELVLWYLQRWYIELDFRTLKSDYGLARLSGKTPDVAQKEIYATLIAYNAARLLMSRSGEQPRMLSMERTRQLLLTLSERMAAAPTVRLPRLFAELCALVGAARIELQERPPEPRQIIQRLTTFRGLTTSRAKWREDYLAA